jgi:hypothetical protein
MNTMNRQRELHFQMEIAYVQNDDLSTQFICHSDVKDPI